MASTLHGVQYSLNNGEVSYRFESRGDIKEYGGALFRALNFYALTVGGQRYRNGTRFVAETKLASTARPISFVFNKFQSYVLEVGDFYLRIRHVDGTLVTITPDLVSPWPESMLPDLYVFQSDDVMYFCSDGTVPVYKLQRIGAEEFQLLQVRFFAPGTVEDKPTGCEIGAGTLTPGATSGNGITFTASSAGFVAADVGRIIVYQGSRAAIITVSSATSVIVDIIDDFPNINPIPCDEWRLTGTPDGTANPSTNHIKHNIIVVDFSVANAIRSTDVGKYIAIYGGFIKILEIIDPTTIKGAVISDLKDIAPGSSSPATVAWTIWRNGWDVDQGFPVCGTFFQGRMYLCRDQTIWASIVGDIENFALGSADDDGINRTIGDDEANSIQWIAAANRLFVGSIGASYMATPSSEGAPLTPNDFNVQHVTADGSEKIKPIRAKGQILNVEFAARKIRELLFDLIEAKAKSPNLMALADHLTEDNQIQGLAYQQAPDSLVWLPLDSGEAAILAYNRDESLVAWSRFRTDGCFLGFCSVPNGHTGRDRIFTVVQRDTGIFIEYFDTEAQLNGRRWRGLYTDSAAVATHSGFIISGLPASLEGQVVKVIGDGFIYDDATVTGGQIDVTPQIDAAEFEVGLPYQGELITLEPRLPETLGAPWTIKSWAKIGVRLRQTLGIEIGQMLREEELQILNTVDFRKISHPIATQVPPQRGKVVIPGFGSDTLGRIVIQQNRPFPAEILSIFGLLTVEDAPRGELFDEPEAVALCAPPPPPVPLPCPDLASVVHVDTGFANIGTASAALDRSTSIVYYESNSALADSTVTGGFAKIIQSFDMNDPSVQYNTLGTARYLGNPITDGAGRLWAVSVVPSGGFGHQRIVELDPTDSQLATINENTSADYNLSMPEILPASTVIYGIQNSTRDLWIFNKTTLALVANLRPDTDFGVTGVQPGFRSGTVDGSGNLWVWVSTRSGNPANNRLMKISPAGALLQDNSLNADYPNTVEVAVMFDSASNSIVLFGDSDTKKWDIASQTIVNSLGVNRITPSTNRNYPSGGRFWWVESDRFVEFDILSWSETREVLFSDIVGTIAGNWSNTLWMPLLDCLHINHGAIGTPTGGVDRLCLPCPPQPISRFSQQLLSSRQQIQQFQRSPFLAR